jgi:hypothetical protein
MDRWRQIECCSKRLSDQELTSPISHDENDDSNQETDRPHLSHLSGEQLNSVVALGAITPI